jgi:hypothetical protein
MRKALVVLAVLVLAAVAWASGNMLGGNVKITLPGDPPTEYKVYIETLSPTNSSFELGGVTYTFVVDEENPSMGNYCAPAPNSGTHWDFTSGSIATFVQWPPYPQLGPPTTTYGVYERDE